MAKRAKNEIIRTHNFKIKNKIKIVKKALRKIILKVKKFYRWRPGNI